MSSSTATAQVHQKEETIVYHGDKDILSLAHETARTGLIPDAVSDCLISLHPEVPKSMALRYFKEVCHQYKLSGRYNRRKAEEIELGPEHALYLIEILVKYAYKWRLIGTALRFQSQDLDNIQANHASMVDSLKHNLIRLLEDWLQKKHKHTLPPTMNFLNQALRSSIVELGAVACELLAKKPESMHGFPGVVEVDLERHVGEGESPVLTHHALPYSIVTVSKDLQSESVTTQLVRTEENKSVLLEVQYANVKHERITYQWLQNMQPLVDDEEYSGTTGPILCVKGDINIDSCKFSCKLSRSGGLSKYFTIPITLKVSCALDKYRQSLASMYLAQPEVPEDTWPPQTSEKHINLALIKQDKKLTFGSKYAHETIRNDIDDVFQQKEKIEYCEVLGSLKCGQVVFVEGRPGCGKTTFVHKITRDWTITHHGPTRLVLLVSLRVLNVLYLQKPTLDLSDILHLFNKLKVSKETLEERDGKGVYFIFDGFDEFSPLDGNDSIVYKILKKSYLSQSTVIVASRPAAIAKWRGKANKVIEVLGYLKDQILEYFDSYPFSEELKSAELRTYLISHPNIFHMCYLPIHAAMVAYLYEVTGEIPRTETEIYTHFTRSTLMRSLSKNVRVDTENIDVTNLSGKEEKLFRQICKLALEKTVLNKQVMQQEEVSEYFESKLDEDISLGLITIDRTADLYNYKNIYTFLHLTFQEYLAAYYISTLTDEQQRGLIEEHGKKDHMLVVWKFYCGLVKFDSEGSMFKAVVCKTAGRTLHNIQCAYESQQSIACNHVLAATLHFESLYLTTPDFTALGYILANNIISSPISLSLIHCAVNSAGIDALLSETGESKTCLLQALTYSSEFFDDIMLRCLQKLLFFSRSLQRLDLSASHATTQRSLDSISSIVSESCSNLTEVSVSNVLIGPNNLQYILSECNQLKRLGLDNSIGVKELEILAAGIKACKGLEYLNISCDTSQDFPPHYFVVQMFELSPNFQTVHINIERQKINLSFSHRIRLEDVTKSTDLKRLHTLKFDDCVSNEIFSGSTFGLKHLSNLEVLTLSNYSLGQGGLLNLINNLDQHWSLRILNLDRVYLRPAGATALSSSLKHCTALTTLYLRENSIEKEGAEALSTAFQYWPNLQELNLDGVPSQANVGKFGAMVLADNLPLCTRLSKVHLNYNDIDDEVARVLLKNPNLAELHLNGNPVRTAWAKTIIFPFELEEETTNISQQPKQTHAKRCCCIIL